MPPKKKNQRIAYYQAHVAPWTEHAGQIGVTQQYVAAFATAVTAAQAAYDAAVAARQASLAATEALTRAMADMDAAGGDLTRTIRAYAYATNDESVYATAQIPAPREPRPAGAPGEPYQIKASLSSAGVVTLRWKCDNPRASGTSYQVSRRILVLPGQSSGDPAVFTPLGYAAKKTFTDATLAPVGPAVAYQIVAVRSGKSGPPARFTLQLGAAMPVREGMKVAA
ncbi:MAG: hypothetical protein ACFCVE_08665 [Phycisphaerae bacterium]